MKKAFTLVELLIVIIIIGILATMAIPQYQKMVERAKWAEPIQILNSIGTACIIYYTEHGFYPGHFSDLDIEIPGTYFPGIQSGVIKKNNFGYYVAGWPNGDRYFLVNAFYDIDGNNDIVPGPNGAPYEPHIWIFSDGTFSNRSGAPKP